MKPHLHSLKDSRAIAAAKQSGSSHPSGLITLVKRANGLEISRTAFIASRVIGGAVERNRCRRRLRERMRNLRNGLKPGWDLLLIARRPLLEASAKDVDDGLENLLKNAGLL